MPSKFEEASSNPLRDPRDRRLPSIAGPCSLVIFGVTGDLAYRKLIPAVYDLASRGLLPAGFGLVGFGRRDWSDQQCADYMKQSAMKHCRTEFHEIVWQRLAEGIRFVSGSFDDPTGYENLAKTLGELDSARGTSGNYAFYLSIPPAAFPVVTQQLEAVKLTASDHPTSWRRAVIEKPFGDDERSAKQLNQLVENTFGEENVFRIDHYLGKETVQNILALRFANVLFEPVWNNKYVDHVQITMAEDIGLGGRAGYYDGIGAARDVIQNHLLQLLALVAMEEPIDFSPQSVQSEKIKVLSAASVPTPLAENVARGQYAAGWQGGEQVVGLTEEEGFNPASTTETYAAMTVQVNTRRWDGVPFFIRTGKRLGRRVTEIALVFKASGHYSFDPTMVSGLGNNALVIRVQPDEGVSLRFGSKVPDTAMEVRDVNMDFAYGEAFTESSPEAYERLILDVLLGEPSLFPVSEEVELSWRVLDPVLQYWQQDDHVQPYPSGSWGPESADDMIAHHGHCWRRP